VESAKSVFGENGKYRLFEGGCSGNEYPHPRPHPQDECECIYSFPPHPPIHTYTLILYPHPQDFIPMR
jgi:hypothetical protein